MRVVVDYDLCEANGYCVRAAPEVFKLAEDHDRLIVLAPSPDEALRDKVRAAIRRCPRSAISVVDD